MTPTSAHYIWELLSSQRYLSATIYSGAGCLWPATYFCCCPEIMRPFQSFWYTPTHNWDVKYCWQLTDFMYICSFLCHFLSSWFRNWQCARLLVMCRRWLVEFHTNTTWCCQSSSPTRVWFGLVSIISKHYSTSHALMKYYFLFIHCRKMSGC